MSNGNTAIPVSPVLDIIKQLQAGEEARALLPNLELELQRVKGQLEQSQNHAQALELKCRDYRDQIDQLNTKVRQTQGERDEAMFRELETNERLDKLVEAIGGVRRDLNNTIGDLGSMEASAKPKPEPVSASPTQETASSTTAASSLTSAPTTDVASGPGESAGDPTVVGEHTSPQPVASEPAASQASVVGTDRPYDGMGYWHKPSDVTWRTFFAGGGIRPSWLSDADLDHT